MSQPLNALQVGLYNRLTGYSALTALVSTRIYDHVPQNATLPFVVIGDDTAVEGDTKTFNGWDMTITIHCWKSLSAGRKDIKAIMGAIYDALHKNESNVTVSGFTLVYLHCEFQQTFQETGIEGDNDHYYHGVQRFRALITET
jgi:hypothetical protein